MDIISIHNKKQKLKDEQGRINQSRRNFNWN
jgi:hypothetical protein